MNERGKITPSHLSLCAVVYLRQSSAAQVENSRESTDRQYALAGKARDLGWPDERIMVIDKDLGLSWSGSAARSGFARLTSEVALARVGLVLGLEVSRLARNNAEWYRVIDMDTAQFAVNAIRRWREIMGCERYPESGRLMIAADGGELHRQAPPSRGSRLKHLFCGVALSSKSAPSRRKHAA